MNVLDLFSGIGGFSLGLERAGMRTVAFCEIEPYCQAVLRKHWPGVPCFPDVRELHAADLPERADVICGGFPCQDISVAGKGAGIDGERSGLWGEYARLIGEVRPSYVIVENVAALLGRGIERVLGDLSEIGYDAEWHVISAADVGAPHLRERVWIVAYPAEREGGKRRDADMQWGRAVQAEQARLGGGDVAYAIGERLRGFGHGAPLGAPGEVCEEVWEQRFRTDAEPGGETAADPDSPGRGEQRRTIAISEEFAAAECGGWWRAEPDVGRVANGVPSRVDRLRALGNAVVPQIPEIIGRAIMSAYGDKCG